MLEVSHQMDLRLQRIDNTLLSFAFPVASCLGQLDLLDRQHLSIRSIQGSLIFFRVKKLSTDQFL
jgi:hypothetical protein